jgi:hypothetical protein
MRATSSYKYKLNEKIKELPRSISIEKIIETLATDHSISRTTFHRDRNIAQESEQSIPSDRLDTYAALFNCSADDLKNYQPKAVKPLTERAPSQAMQKIIKKNGLKKS